MKKTVIFLSILCVISIMSVIVLVFNEKKFIVPEIEKSVKQGMPDINEEYKYSSLNVKDGYTVSLAGNPKIKNNTLYLYFANDSDNNILCKLKVFYNDKEVGSTGIIEPGKYIESITLKSGNYKEKLVLKIMGYEKDTYQSAGAISLNLKV